jgi:hypothetical protein
VVRRAEQNESNPAIEFDGEKQAETRLLLLELRHDVDALGARLAGLEGLVFAHMHQLTDLERSLRGEYAPSNRDFPAAEKSSQSVQITQELTATLLEPISGTMTAGDRRYRITGNLEQETSSRNRRWRGSIMLDGLNEVVPSTPNNLVRLELDDNRAGEFSVVGMTFTRDGRREYRIESYGHFG